MDSIGKPSNYGKPWTRDELILAFELYCCIPFQKTKANNPQVRRLVGLLNRSPASIARKLGNFGAFDPSLREQDISGLGHGSRLDREIWDEFLNDWSGLVLQAYRLRSSLEKDPDENLLELRPQGPSERIVMAKQRIHQQFFRAAVMSSYENRCCITGIPVTECLIASHIVPWSADERYRADPTNGLCLSATFDRLFDVGLLTITHELKVRMSKKLVDSKDTTIVDLICFYNYRLITLPSRFAPSLERMAWHEENVFQP